MKKSDKKSGKYIRTEKTLKLLSKRAKKAVGSLNAHWKGGIHKRKDGYILVRIGIVKRSAKGARYKLLHRIVMEEHLGRPLLRSEVVHHKNFNKSDNRIKNLQIMTQSEHAKKEYKEFRRINKKGQLIKGIYKK